MLTQEELPESLTGPCLDVLKEVLPDERELIRIVVEIVHKLRDRENTAEETAFTVCRPTVSCLVQCLPTLSHPAAIAR